MWSLEVTRRAGPGIPSPVSMKKSQKKPLNAHAHTHSSSLHLNKPLRLWLHYLLAPLRTPRRWGQTEFGFSFYPEPRGFTGIYTPGPENGQDPHSSTLLLLRSRRALGLHRRRRRLGTHREKKWNWFLEGGFSAHASQHASLNTAVMENNYEKTLL